ncbi:MAG: DMT family transporter, partial [Actinomycetota bacterium]|nr:DMT family transporter [Actinomycetota bacterium]
PVAAGLAGGEHLSILAVAAIGIAVVAIALVSRGESQPSQGAAASTGQRGNGLLWGSLSGVGFAVLFIALDRAGTSSGAWPLLPSGGVSLLLVLPFGWVGRPRHRGQLRSCAVPLLVAGIVGGGANLLFLTATGYGQLSLVAVITSLYPAVTVVLARIMLGEQWTRLQTTGLIAAVLAIVATTMT